MHVLRRPRSKLRPNGLELIETEHRRERGPGQAGTSSSLKTAEHEKERKEGEKKRETSKRRKTPYTSLEKLHHHRERPF